MTRLLSTILFCLSLTTAYAVESGTRVTLQQDLSLKSGTEVLLDNRHMGDHPCVLSYDNETDGEVTFPKGTYFRVIFADQLVTRTSKRVAYGQTFISLGLQDDRGGFTAEGKEVKRMILIKISCNSSGEFISGAMAKLNTPSVKRTLKAYSDYFAEE